VIGKFSLGAERVIKMHSIKLVELVELATQEMEDHCVGILGPARIELNVTRQI
jgi:hypothetical protein